MEVRRVRPEEYEDAGRVVALAYREFAPPGDEGWERYLKELADVAARADRTDVFVAVDDGRVLGSVSLEVDRTIGDDDITLPPEISSIRMLGVDPSSRRRGVGRALVEACIDRSRRAGKSVITLRTTGRMEAAQLLYASMGFQRDESRDLVFEDGFRLLAYRLELA